MWSESLFFLAIPTTISQVCFIVKVVGKCLFLCDSDHYLLSSLFRQGGRKVHFYMRFRPPSLILLFLSRWSESAFFCSIPTTICCLPFLVKVVGKSFFLCDSDHHLLFFYLYRRLSLFAMCQFLNIKVLLLVTATCIRYYELISLLNKEW